MSVRLFSGILTPWSTAEITASSGDDAAIQETFKASTSIDVSGKLFVECRFVSRSFRADIADKALIAVLSCQKRHMDSQS